MSISRMPVAISRIASFKADLNVPVFISITDIHVLMPFWKRTSCGFSDATGSYDLCMNEDLTRLKFVLVSGDPGDYAFLFIPGNWFPKRKGFQTP